MNELLIGRKFQFWEYRVSHGSILIRSPKFREDTRNIDVKFFGVTYVAVPRHLEEIDIKRGGVEEVNFLKNVLGETIEQKLIYVIKSKQNRHLIVAAGIKIEASLMDIFDSPF